MLSMKRLVKPALCLLLGAGPALAQDQVKPYQLNQTAAMSNQQLAELVAQKLKCCGQMKDYHVDVVCQGGVVELSGVCCDMGQRSMAARVASQVPGVVKVVNHVAVKRGEVVQTKFSDSEETVAIPPAPTASSVVTGSVALQSTDPQSIAPAPTVAAAPPAAPGEPLPPANVEPMPSFRAGMAPPGGTNAMMPPPMPPYAWPTYAPYNNYSRVAYPIAYPAEAFPFIGPVHPFPKAPLGWRSVTLSFDDGHWWLKSNSQKRDWWILRYW